MINFALRIQNLQAARDRGHRELDGSRTVLRDEAMRERRNQVEATFRAGMDVLANEFSQAEASLNTELSAAEFKVWLASITLPETATATYKNVERALPGL